jgi:hypothetical protein
MTKIKFRAWDTCMEFMKYDCDTFNVYHENDNGLHSGYENKDGDWCENILMQCTGLLDKNGVEIYRGDIIEFPDGDIGEVIFDNGMFCTTVGCFIPNIEVIGNIYENPELLEG